MNIKNYSIYELLVELNNRCSPPETGLLNSQSNKKIMEHLAYNPNTPIGIVLTYGKPKDITEKNHKCSRCGKLRPSEYFSYYQSRIDNEGYLLRTNAICSICAEKINKERHEILDNILINENILEKPKKGDVCPQCDREWYGNWHRHHDPVTLDFVGWICGHCNMKLDDQRNLSAINRKIMEKED